MERFINILNEIMLKHVSLGLIRSDIMLESHLNGPSKGSLSSQQCGDYVRCSTGQSSSPFCCWKQVELNTIASGFGWLGPVSADIHR